MIKLGIILLLAAAAHLAGAAATDKPNIVFILADDLGWSDTTLYGQTKLYQTPNLERLARRGMLFTRAYEASPLCSPSRASIMTGLNPARIGITAPVCHVPKVKLQETVREKAPPYQKSLIDDSATRLSTNYYTLAKALKDDGYATGHFGKWHLGAEPYSPLQQGFDVDLPHWWGPGPPGSYLAPWKFPARLNFPPRTPHENIEDRMAYEAVKWMTANKDRPFFLNYWMFSVHAPFDAKPDLIEKYRRLIAQNDPQHKDPQHSPTYAAMVETMDDAVGTLLDAIDRLGIADHTIIVFTSDNGGNMYSTVDNTTPTSNFPLRGGKATVYEGGTRVPCIVDWPGLTKPGSTNDTVMQGEDFYPTFVDLLGLKTQPGQSFDGFSLANALAGKPLAPQPIFAFFPHTVRVPDALPPAVTVTEGDKKLMRLFHDGQNGADAYRLYDLKDDLGETKDLSAQQPELAQQMNALITKFLTDTKAVVPGPNPYYDPKAKVPPTDARHRPPKKRAKAAVGPAQPDPEAEKSLD